MEKVLQGVGKQPFQTYLERNKEKMAEWVASRSIFEVCARETATRERGISRSHGGDNHDLGYPKSLVRICMHAHLLSILEEAPLEVIQDGQNWDTNKLVASVKYIWVVANPLSVELGV